MAVNGGPTISKNTERVGFLLSRFLVYRTTDFRLSMPQKRRRSEGSEATDVKFICTTNTLSPHELQIIEKTMAQLGADTLQFDFAIGVFEASELDTVRLHNNTSISDLQMLP